MLNPTNLSTPSLLKSLGNLVALQETAAGFSRTAQELTTQVINSLSGALINNQKLSHGFASLLGRLKGFKYIDPESTGGLALIAAGKYLLNDENALVARPIGDPSNPFDLEAGKMNQNYS